MTVHILGAGMAGLLAGRMLHRMQPVLYERQPHLPDNHGALLRFRSVGVDHETGIAFRGVRVLKAVKSGGRLRQMATLADANCYAFKVTGAITPRSVMDLAPVDRYIAPATFLADLADGLAINLGHEVRAADLDALKQQTELVVISTIPMPVLMRIVGWPDPPRFDYRPVWSVTIEFLGPLVDVYQTIYYPDLDTRYYRASITGARIILEYMTDPGTLDEVMAEAAQVTTDFGLPCTEAVRYVVHEAKRQEYGKLVPLDAKVREEFILAMTDTYNLYSVGRFATWRQILLDDVVGDIRAVERMITQRSTYHRRLSRVER